MSTIDFTVYGEAKSAGSKRAFLNKHTGKVNVTETVKGSKAWQSQVAQVAGAFAPPDLLTDPLVLELTFYVPRPRSHFGTGRNAGKLKPSAPSAPATRPDVLKLARGVEDALTGVIWRDDAQIVDEFLHKRYGPSRVEIEVRKYVESSLAVAA